MEESAHKLGLLVGQEVFQGMIEILLMNGWRRISQGGRNMGTEKRWMVSSLGTMGYKRRVYLDEQGNRIKPVDEWLGLQRYARMSGRVQEMGASLVSSGTYRLAAEQFSSAI